MRTFMLSSLIMVNIAFMAWVDLEEGEGKQAEKCFCRANLHGQIWRMNSDMLLDCITISVMIRSSCRMVNKQIGYPHAVRDIYPFIPTSTLIPELGHIMAHMAASSFHRSDIR